MNFCTTVKHTTIVNEVARCVTPVEWAAIGARVRAASEGYRGELERVVQMQLILIEPQQTVYAVDATVRVEPRIAYEPYIPADTGGTSEGPLQSKPVPLAVE